MAFDLAFVVCAGTGGSVYLLASSASSETSTNIFTMSKKAASSIVIIKNVRPTSAAANVSESKGATGLWIPIQVEYMSLRGPRKARHAAFMAPTSVDWDYAPALDAIAPGWTKDANVFQKALTQLRRDKTFFFSVVRYGQKDGTIHSAIVNPLWKPRTMEEIRAECRPKRRALGIRRRPIVTVV